MRMLGEHESAAPITSSELVSAQRTCATSHDWEVPTARATLTLRPFMDIHGEPYRVYQDVVTDASAAAA
jgi:hypothetical protein